MYHATTLNQVLHKGNPKSVFFLLPYSFFLVSVRVAKGCPWKIMKLSL